MKPVLGALALAFVASAAAAQPALPTCKRPDPQASTSKTPEQRTYQELWCERVFEVVDARTGLNGTGAQAGARVAIENAVEAASRNWPAFLLYAQARSRAVDSGPVEDARTDKQVGAPAGAGSTSVVSKGAVPGILGFAVENGALTQTTSDTTITLRGNAVGWLDLLKNQEFIASYQDGSSFVRGLRKISYSVTLNSDTQPATATTSPSSGPPLTPAAIQKQLDKTRQQVAGYSVRYAIVDRRDPRTASNRAAIATFADTHAVELLKANNAFSNFLASQEYTLQWFPQTVDLLADPSRPLSVAQIQRILYQRLEILRLLMISRIDTFDEAVSANLLAYQAFDKARLKLFEAMRMRPLFAFEMVNARAAEVPDKYTFRFIAEGEFGSHFDLTANAATTYQREGEIGTTEVTKVGGWRDFQAAVQLDIPLGSLQKRLSAGAGIGAPVLGFAMLIQKLNDQGAVNFAGTAFTLEPGWVEAFQAKVSIPVKGSGVKIPLSLTYSNRTELVKEKQLRGHIGVTFDMDVLASAVRR
jgi:hypothetical protein